MKTYVMVDVETMSQKPNAAIVQIGAIRFDPFESIIETNIDQIDRKEKFCVNVDLASSQLYGLRIEADTVMWWLKQERCTQDALITPKPISLSEALHEFRTWYLNYDVLPTAIWSHGSSFDLPILTNAYTVTGLKKPWKNHYEFRDTRTLFWLVDGFNKDNFVNLPKHYALYDCYNQVQWVQWCYKTLTKKGTR